MTPLRPIPLRPIPLRPIPLRPIPLRRGLAALTVTAGLLTAGALVSAAPATSAHVAPVDCGSRTYGDPANPLESSHYGVGDVRASGLSCGNAMAIALRSQDRGTARYTAKGYSCDGRRTADGSVSWRCKQVKAPKHGARGKVRFFSIG